MQNSDSRHGGSMGGRGDGKQRVDNNGRSQGGRGRNTNQLQEWSSGDYDYQWHESEPDESGVGFLARNVTQSRAGNIEQSASFGFGFSPFEAEYIPHRRDLAGQRYGSVGSQSFHRPLPEETAETLFSFSPSERLGGTTRSASGVSLNPRSSTPARLPSVDYQQRNYQSGPSQHVFSTYSLAQALPVVPPAQDLGFPRARISAQSDTSTHHMFSGSARQQVPRSPALTTPSFSQREFIPHPQAHASSPRGNVGVVGESRSAPLSGMSRLSSGQDHTSSHVQSQTLGAVAHSPSDPLRGTTSLTFSGSLHQQAAAARRVRPHPRPNFTEFHGWEIGIDVPLPPIATRPHHLGQNGRQINLHANYFMLKLDRIKQLCFQYDVHFSPPTGSVVASRRLIEIADQNGHFGNVRPVFDGKSLYTVVPFSKELFAVENLQLTKSNTGNSSTQPTNKGRRFTLTIERVTTIPLGAVIGRYLIGRIDDLPQPMVDMLDATLRYYLSRACHPIGRAIFYRASGAATESLGGGMELWRGHFQTVRVIQDGIALNIDTSAKAMVSGSTVLDYLQTSLVGWNRNRPLTSELHEEAANHLMGLKIEITHRGKARAQYRIKGLSRMSADQESFPLEDGRTLTVSAYFSERYTPLVCPHLPCLVVGQKSILLPMEVCRIVAGQEKRVLLTADQTRKMLEVTSQMPRDKMRTISEAMPLKTGSEDPYMKDFGIELEKNMLEVSGRVLGSPSLNYLSARGEVTQLKPRNGAWSINEKQLLHGTVIGCWLLVNWGVNPQHLHERDLRHWLRDFCKTLVGKGIQVPGPPPIINGDPRQVWETMSALTEDEPTIVLCLLPTDRTPLYDEIKRLCETDLGLVTQCLDAKKVANRRKSGIAYQINLAMKINAKLGGTNNSTRELLPLVGECPTLVIGADVHHPPPSIHDKKPSLAALVGSYDRSATRYATVVRALPHRTDTITDMKECVSILLRTFRQQTGRQPEHIIVYREGVNEGSEETVYGQELRAIVGACTDMGQHLRPKITFIVVHRRNHTRLFPANDASSDPSGNLIPGTVVDSGVTDPKYFDFFMCSHAGVRGSSKPTYYQVRYDENSFSADSIQDLTFKLCHVYARCSRSVSIPAPLYYAHLSAYRARLYDLQQGPGVVPHLTTRLWYV